MVVLQNGQRQHPVVAVCGRIVAVAALHQPPAVICTAGAVAGLEIYLFQCALSDIGNEKISGLPVETEPPGVSQPKGLGDMSLEAEIIKVTEYPEIMKYNIMSTPGLVINEKLVSAGRIPTEAQVTTWITDTLETQSI